ncbi:hypothetical protein [Bacillus mesophilum]|uniref:competence protein CoiA family protein n=1 Tax=Bacillus mesophilum TaxID=1071718 RepID=UPI001863C1D5|nr:hypothetical protein [Bacillus mesophilum]
MQFTYVPYFNNWESVFPSGKETIAFEKRFIELDSMKLDKQTEGKLIQGKNSPYKAFCPVCEEQMSFKRGYDKKSPHFFHINRDECFSFESLAHGSTKKYLYRLFMHAGYHVKEESFQKGNEKGARADVAVLHQINGEKEIKLAIEVQASGIRIAEVVKRINFYYEKDVPTAWILVLDSFFPPRKVQQAEGEIEISGYEGTRISTFNTEEKKYDFTYIEPTEERPFFVTGKINKAFDFLMDLYHTVVAVDHEGYVFLIRREPDSAYQRAQAILDGESIESLEDKFLISRIEESYIVPLLLETEVLPAEFAGEQADYSSERNTVSFTGSEHRSEMLEKLKRADNVIDYRKPGTMEESLNSVKLARESRVAQREALKKLQKEREEQRKRDEEEKRKEEIRKKEEEWRREQNFAQEKREVEQRFIHESAIFRQNWQADLKAREFIDFQEFRYWINDMEQSLSIWKKSYETLAFTPNFSEEVVAFMEAARSNYEYHQEKQRRNKRLLAEKQRKVLEENEARESWRRKLDILNKNEEEFPAEMANEIISVRQDFWNIYVNLPPKENKVLFEKKHFPNGLAPWFLKRKFKWQQQQTEIQKKKWKEEEKNKAKLNKQKRDKLEEYEWEQLKLF